MQAPAAGLICLPAASDCGMSLGQVWAAMAMFKGHRRRRAILDGEEESEMDDDTDAVQPKRRKYTAFNESFVDSSTMQVGSSSPPYGSSRESSLSSVGYVDLNSHISELIPEDDTLRLATCAIRHILYFSSAQAPESSVVVELRDARTRIAATTGDEKQIVAVDDGGLCLRQRKRDMGFRFWRQRDDFNV
ncbi:uncharacterized protein DSM5745_09956 [Aspergillus mulundensis]|uniref:Uncharacterized protein n=1 Tax=Aspergillus mulundensis TaxID=1810919 RepID=A0A3D8QRW7_9EURO|nr:hypothetical protein DSM5745_09956 [Aspergillus mulundensis]RDW64545.1 hypothetical protein DSM5745_09956 [Aspergillus mulundensis]